MTESKKTLESEGTTARPKEKPYVPIENRPLLGVDEVEAHTGVPAKIIRANVHNGLLKACMAGSTTMRIRRRDLDEWLDMLPAWRACRKTPLAPDCGRSGVLQNTIGAA